MIQRYDLEYESEDVGTPMVMEPADDGDYVTFDDHESEVAALRAEVERIEDSIHEANEAREDAERERDALRAEVARLTERCADADSLLGRAADIIDDCTSHPCEMCGAEHGIVAEAQAWREAQQ